jgi:hypothetical protein
MQHFVIPGRDKLVAAGSLRPLTVAGFVGSQACTDSGVIMRRLSDVELVLVYEFTKPITRMVQEHQVDVCAGQTGTTAMHNKIQCHSCSEFALLVHAVCELLNLLDLQEDEPMRSIWQPAVQRYIATIGPYFARASSKSFSLTKRYLDPLLHLLEVVCSATCGEDYDSCDDTDRPFVRCGTKMYKVKKAFTLNAASFTPTNACCRLISVSKRNTLLRSKSIAATPVTSRSNDLAVREGVSARRMIQKMIDSRRLSHEAVLQVKSFSNMYFHLHRFVSAESLKPFYMSASPTVICTHRSDKSLTHKPSLCCLCLLCRVSVLKTGIPTIAS